MTGERLSNSCSKRDLLGAGGSGSEKSETVRSSGTPAGHPRCPEASFFQIFDDGQSRVAVAG